jgi:hypothetical protein
VVLMVWVRISLETVWWVPDVVHLELGVLVMMIAPKRDMLLTEFMPDTTIR